MSLSSPKLNWTSLWEHSKFKSMSIKIITSFFLTLTILFTIACKPKSEVAPTDLKGKRTLLTEQKQKLKEIQASIEKLQEEIEDLEPVREVKKVLVSLDTIQEVEFKQYTNVQATVVPDDFVNASSETGGRILKRMANEGDYVRKGQLLATVDMQTLEKQLDEIATSYTLAKTVYERQKRLWDQNIGSELQYLEAKTKKESLEKSTATLRSQLNKKNVYAPISGIVDQEFLQEGEMSSPGVPILRILNTRKIKIVADLPENYLGAVKRNDKVSVYFPALDKTIDSRITMLGRTIDPANRTFKIEIQANNNSGTLKPNLLAEVEFNNYTNKNAITLGAELIQEDVNGAKYIYTIETDDKGNKLAKKQIVETGESFDNNIEILSGLNVGDVHIVEGARSVSAGNIIITQTK